MYTDDYLLDPYVDVVERDCSAAVNVMAFEEVSQPAKEVGTELRDIAEECSNELTEALNDNASRNVGASIRNMTYNVFSETCSSVLRRTFDRVSNSWDQTLLVFASYARMREALQGDTLQQNEMAMYLGQYLNNMGFHSWISWVRQHDSWVRIYHNPLIC